MPDTRAEASIRGQVGRADRGGVGRWAWVLVGPVGAMPAVVLALRSPQHPGGLLQAVVLLLPLLPGLSWLQRRCRDYLPAQHAVLLCDVGILTCSVLACVLAFPARFAPAHTFPGSRLLGVIGIMLGILGAILAFDDLAPRSSRVRAGSVVGSGAAVVAAGAGLLWWLYPAVGVVVVAPVVAIGLACVLVASGQAILDNRPPSRTWLLSRTAAVELPLVVMAVSAVLLIALCPRCLLAGWLRPIAGVVLVLILIRAVAGRVRVHQRAAQLQALAFVDPLTGLGNRRSLVAHIGEGHLRSAVMFDLDRFKDVNDDLGHDTGDRVLLAFAATLRQVLPADSHILRTGGDEFVALLPVAVPQAQVLVRAVLETDLVFGGRLIEASAGVVPLLPATPAPPSPGPGASDPQGVRGAAVSSGERQVRAVFRDTDVALRRAKAMHGRQLALLDEPGRRQRQREVKVEAALPGALGTGRVRVRYRPIYDVGSGRIDGVRIVTCWDDGELGPVGGVEIGNAAERCGLMDDVVRVCRDRTLADYRRWRTQRVQVKLFVPAPTAVWLNPSGGLLAELLRLGVRPQDVVVELPGSQLGGTRHGEQVGPALRKRSVGIGLLDTPLLLPGHAASSSGVDYLRIRARAVQEAETSVELQREQAVMLRQRTGVRVIAEAETLAAAWCLAEDCGASHAFASGGAPITAEQVLDSAGVNPL